MRVIMEPADTVGQKKLAEALKALGVVLMDDDKVQMATGDSAGPLGKLCFNFDVVSKHDVMMKFLEMYEEGLIRGRKNTLQTFLATYSNLGTKESVHKLYVRCLNEYVRKGH